MHLHTHRLIGKTIHKLLLDTTGLKLSEKDFKKGCILPDLDRTLIAIPHYKHHSFSVILDMIEKLNNTCIIPSERHLREFTVNLGIIMHYLTDYFCYSHNNKDYDRMPFHIIYELLLDRELRKLLSSASYKATLLDICRNRPSEIISFSHYIEEKHREYLSRKHSLLNDLTYGMEVCSVIAMEITCNCLSKPYLGTALVS